jgi:MFS family permease
MQLSDSQSKTLTQYEPDPAMSQDRNCHSREGGNPLNIDRQTIDRETINHLVNQIDSDRADRSPNQTHLGDDAENNHHQSDRNGDREHHDHDSQPVKSQPGFGPVLKNANFLALWSGQVFSQLADKVYLVLMIAIIASTFQQPGQSISSWVSAIMIAFTIPAVLFGYLAGAFVDRWQKKTVLVVTNLLRGMFVLVLPMVLWMSQGLQLGKLPLGFCLMLGITFLVSTLTQFFAPAEQSAIPLIVKREQLLAANSLYTTTMMASVIIGFAVGEPVLDFADRLLSNLGNGLTMGKELVVGGAYCFAGLLLLLMRIRETPNNSEQESVHVLAEIRDGVAYLGKNRRVRSAMMQLTILFCVFAALAVLAVRLAEVIPAIESDQFGFLLAAGGVGMGIGAAILGHFGPSIHPSPA